MFENLLYQDEASASLSACAKDGGLPPSLLLHGPYSSGKTTAALELARALSCDRGAEWNCPCSQCERHRRISHPDVLISGPDSFGEEIAAALGGLARSGGKRELYAFLRALRRLTRRFDGELWEGEEGKLSKAVPLLSSIEELLPSLDPSLAPIAPEDAAAAAAKVAAETVKLIPLAPASIPVFQVRNAIRWMHLSPTGKRKVLIVENAETMLDSARNAFLKLLEEPPERSVVVLTSVNRSSLIETVLSRLRPVAFRERGKTESADVLKRIFGEDGGAPLSVSAFLEGYKRPSNAELEAVARAMVSRAFLKAAPAIGVALPASISSSAKEGEEVSNAAALEREPFQRFCRALLSEISRCLRAFPASPAFPSLTLLAASWADAVREAAMRSQALNQSPQALMRALLGAMEEGS
jgi:DNA polymerase III subunit gamma/tau